MTTILQGIVGSTAYGLATPESDVDTLAVHLAPIYDAMTFGFSKSQKTAVTSAPDSTSHEVAKYLDLVLKGNPTVTELLWLNSYTVKTDAGVSLCSIRSELLGAKAIRDSYGGYAMQQITRLMNRNGSFSADTDKRKPKHARHCLRLLLQGEELLSTGFLRVALLDWQKETVWRASEFAEAEEWGSLKALYDLHDSILFNAYHATSLPESGNREAAKETLWEIRSNQLAEGP